MINVEHIEELMFDYFEGNLSPEKMKELEKFVQDNPSYQVDFDSWKDSYVEQDDKKMPFAYTSLLAGTGAAWLKWAGLGLVLFFAGYGTYAYLNRGEAATDTAQNQVIEKSETDNVLIREALTSDIEPQQLTSKKDDPIAMAERGVGNDHQSVNQGSGEGTGTENDHPRDRDSLKDGVSAGLDKSSQNAKVSNKTKRSKDASGKAKRGRTSNKSITSQAYGESKAEDPKGKTKRYAFSKKSQDQPEHKNLALAQAVNFFEDGSRGGANQFSYDGSFPSLNLSNRNSKKTGRESGLARLIRNISNGILPVQELGLRNFRDPYFVIPEFKSAIAQNGGYAGSFGGLRAKLSYRYMSGVHQANASFDTRFGNDFKIGAGGMINQLLYEDDNIKSSKTDIALIFAPKFELSRTASFSPSITLNAGRQLHMIKQGIFNSVELERGQVINVGTELETDSLMPGTINHDYVDMSVGGMLQTKSFHLGFQLNNLFTSTYNANYLDLVGAASTPLDLKVVLGTDYKYSDFSSTTFSPSIVFNQRGNYTDVWMGAYMRTGKLLIGANYGNHGEGAAMIGIQTPRMRFTLSGDYTKRYLLNEKTFSFGTSLRLFLGKKSRPTDLPQT